MTLSKVTVEPLQDLTNWYKLTFVSRKDGIGQTSVELLCSSESLSQFRSAINNAIGEPQTDWSNAPKNLRKFMEGEK